jgi:ubiquinone/menaquinone biosynthesis C-methylase UbiE
MAHRPSNRQRSGWVVSLLGAQPADQVLEIGFGPGLAVAELVRAGAGHVYGLDHSGVMLRQACTQTLPLSPPVACVLAASPAPETSDTP